MYHRWGSLPAYQRTRGALAFLATAVNGILNSSGSTVQPLLGPGDVLLEHDATRNALFTQVGEREHYSSVLSADIVGSERVEAVDRRVGESSPALRRMQVGTRLATAAFLYSFGARQGEERGVARNDLVAACLSPELDRSIITTTLHELQETLLYLHYTGGRYRFETRPNLNKLLADQAREYESGEIQQHIRQRLERVVGKVAGSEARLWPDDSSAVPDRVPAFQVVYLGPAWCNLTQEEVQQQARQWIEQRGSSKRVYKNGLALAVPTGSYLDTLRQQMRMVLAVETLLGARKRHGISDEQVEELHERQRKLNGEIDAGLKRLYETVLLPVEGQPGDEPMALETLDLRTKPLSESLHARILESLRHWVFASVVPTRLVALTRLGQDERHTVNCETLVEWCFSFLSFPKLLGVDPIRKAIATGVQDGVFGYSAAVQFDEQGQPFVSTPGLVRFGVVLQPAEVDLGNTSHLIAPNVAATLATPDVGPVAGGAEMDTGDAAAPAPHTPAIQPPSPLPTTPDPQVRAGRRYHLSFTANKQQLFRAFRPLQNLAEKSGTLTVTLTVSAQAETPLDAAWLRNAVEEPLDEADVEFERRLEA